MNPCTILLPAYGEKFVHTFIHLHTLAIPMQCIASQGGKLVILLHEFYWANLHDRGNHLFCGLGKMFYHYMYVHLLHYSMYHIKTCMINYVTRNILPCTFIKQQLVKLRCTCWGSCWYLFASLVTFSVSFILLLIMSPFADIDQICMGGFIMRETHELDVSLSIFCTTCSNGSMRGGMATTTTYVFSFEVGHEIDSHPLYSHGQVFGLMLLSYSGI